jgi:hypothetical protein
MKVQTQSFSLPEKQRRGQKTVFMARFLQTRHVYVVFFKDGALSSDAFRP